MASENSTTALIQITQSPALARVSNQLVLTDKLLTKPEEPFLIPYRKGNKWGFCDRNKNIVIDCVYDSLHDLPDYRNKNIITSWRNGYFVHNKKGELIWKHQNEFEGGAFTTGGLAAVLERDKWGFIDDTGKAITPLKYDFVSSFYEGLAVVKFDKKNAFLNRKGQEVMVFTDDQYDDIEPFGNGLARVGLSGKYGFINKQGAVVIPLIYDDTGTYGHTTSFSEGIVNVKLNDKWGYINGNGNEIAPFIYGRTYQFTNGMALVKRWVELSSRGWQTKQFFINVHGEEVIELDKYDYSKSFSDNLALVARDSLCGYIDQKGNEVIPLYFDYNKGWIDHACNFYEGIAAVTKKSNWGYIDQWGKAITPIKYKYCQPFKKGLGEVTLFDNNSGYIDNKGNEYWED